jgi:hypothetical protein
VRTLMRAAGPWILRKEYSPKVCRPLNRRACLGELIQFDGSDHRWFEQQAPACTLLVFIDDASGWTILRVKLLPSLAERGARSISTPSVRIRVARRARRACRSNAEDRLVEELQLHSISTVAPTNAYAPFFIAAYNARLAKPPVVEHVQSWHLP